MFRLYNTGISIGYNLSLSHPQNCNVQLASLVNTISLGILENTYISNKSFDIRQKVSPGMPEELISFISYKNNLLQKRKNNKTLDLVDNIECISKIIKFCNNKLMNNYYLHNIDRFKGDAKKTWKFLDRETRKYVRLSKDLITIGGLVITSESEKADIINTLFNQILFNQIRRSSFN